MIKKAQAVLARDGSANHHFFGGSHFDPRISNRIDFVLNSIEYFWAAFATNLQSVSLP